MRSTNPLSIKTGADSVMMSAFNSNSLISMIEFQTLHPTIKAALKGFDGVGAESKEMGYTRDTQILNSPKEGGQGIASPENPPP